ACLLRLVQAIIAERVGLDFMTVAKAMIIEAWLQDRDVAELADWLGISKQTRYNWLDRKLAEWENEWTGRLRARKERSPAAKKRQTKISEAEWRWMAQVLARNPQKSWGFRQRVI